MKESGYSVRAHNGTAYVGVAVHWMNSGTPGKS